MKTKVLLCFAFLLGSLFVATAGERKFTYTYEAEVLPKGVRELEIWSTYHYRSPSEVIQLANRIELEWGLGGNLQTAFYVNINTVAGGGERSTRIGISNEWIYQLLDPAQTGIGLALYGEWGLAADERELEFKLIGQTFVNEVIIAANLIGEREWKQQANGWEVEEKVEFAAGVSVPLGSVLSLGVEALALLELHEGEVEAAPLFGGPVLSVRQPGWWATLTFAPQIRDFQIGAQNLNDFDRWQARLLFSWILK